MESGPTVANSELGWLLCGPLTSTRDCYFNDNGIVGTHLVISGGINQFRSSNEEIIDAFKEIWGCDSKESGPNTETSFEDACNVAFNGRRYEVSLPWRHDIEEPKVDSKYSLCYNRWLLLQKRFKGNPDLYLKYNEIFEEQLRLGIIDRVPTEVENIEGVEFLPHHGVAREDRDTTKLRIVFDGSAMTYSDHLSLNDRLMNGPNCVPHLIDVLLRFRCHHYALTADIEKAFLQIEIREKDRDKLRFLWLRDVESNNPSIVQFGFCRLAFGLRPSPSILGATIKKHLEGYTARFPKPVEVLGHLFVDDLSCSTESFDSAMDKASISKAILAERALICGNSILTRQN